MRHRGDSEVFSVRASASERRAWTEAAEHNGQTLNRWIRQSLNDQALLDLALREEERRHAGEEEAAEGEAVLA